MLSQETATGNDPVNVVRTMASIICEAEHYGGLDNEQYRQLLEEEVTNPVLTAAASFHNTAATLLLDPDGTLYPVLSRWSRKVPTILITRHRLVARQASLYKNITPIIIPEVLHRDEVVLQALQLGIRMGCICHGDLVAVVEGDRVTPSGIDQDGALQLVRVPMDDG
jgi:pyruvate kinase